MKLGRVELVNADRIVDRFVSHAANLVRGDEDRDRFEYVVGW